jgi:hypothetical protein
MVLLRECLRATYLAVKTMVCGGDLRDYPGFVEEMPQGYIPSSENHSMWW